MEGPVEIPNRYSQDFKFPNSLDLKEEDLTEDAVEIETDEGNNLPEVLAAEHGPEKTESEKTIEAAQEARADLMLRILLGRLSKITEIPALTKILNHIPILGDLKMMSGALTGKEGTHKLTAGERLTYTLAAATGVLVVYFLTEGDYSTAAIGECVSGALTKLDHLPVLMKSLSNALVDKTPKTAHLITTVTDFVLSKREMVANVLSEMLKSTLSIIP